MRQRDKSIPVGQHRRHQCRLFYPAPKYSRLPQALDVHTSLLQQQQQQQYQDTERPFVRLNNF